MVTRLGAWDCPYCGHKKILGNVFDCPGCSHPRPRGIRFYQIPNGPIVTPEIAKQLGSGGPNWYCEHCDSGNKDNNTHCWNCGAERGTSPSHEVREYKQGERVPQSTEEAEEADDDDKSWVEYNEPYEPEEIETSEELTPTTETEFPKEPLPFSQEGEYKENKKISLRKIASGGFNYKPYLIAMGLIAGIVIFGVLIYQIFFNLHQETVVIDGFQWTQNVSVEEYQVVRESSWTTHPNDAYNIDSSYKDTGRNKKVTDGWRTVSYTDICTGTRYVSRTCTGTRDNGDGSFSTYTYECGGSETYTYPCTKTRQEEIYHYEDVYDWYYTYNIDRWIEIANYPTSGTDQEPYFYAVSIEKPYNGIGVPEIGQQRYDEIPGEYNVAFFCEKNTKVGKEGYFTKNYPLDDWLLFDEEETYTIEVNFFNIIMEYPSP